MLHMVYFKWQAPLVVQMPYISVQTASWLLKKLIIKSPSKFANEISKGITIFYGRAIICVHVLNFLFLTCEVGRLTQLAQDTIDAHANRYNRRSVRTRLSRVCVDMNTSRIVISVMRDAHLQKQCSLRFSRCTKGFQIAPIFSTDLSFFGTSRNRD